MNKPLPPTVLNTDSVEAVRHMRDALETYVEWHGGVHDDLCPEDDTCDCSRKWVNDGVNTAVRFLAGLQELRQLPPAGRVPLSLNSTNDWWHFPGGQPA